MEILDFLANPIILLLITIPVMLLIGLLLGVYASQPRRNRVIQIAPESGRGIEYEVEKEDTINAYCNPVSNSPPQRFIKLHQAFNIVRHGFMKPQNYALWIGRQGTAYTQEIGDNPVKVPLRMAIYNLFGKDLYDHIPNNERSGYIRDKIERSEVAVIVEFPQSNLTPKGADGKELPSLSSDDVRRGAFDTFVGAVVHGVQKLAQSGGRTEWGKVIFVLGSGIAVGIVLSLIFKWGAPVIISPGK